MYKFNRWLIDKYYSKDINSQDFSYWHERMVQAYYEGDESALITILDDWAEGLIYLTPTEEVILKANLDEFERDVVK